ncbi:rhodanese-like domain-containing protein [Parasphingorhabdus litoris]|uniref:Rhodanese-like domain-containing protein n=1 Tax=Parasphingorhabdus litoris TaxID=394733 RepID=A0ABN1A262_9SPHN|nr:rhodanese-like domain-containing protein [Parasphingorhabdus litoris]
MKWKAKASIALLLCSSVTAAGFMLFSGDDSGLAKVHDGIESQFTEVSHIDGDGLSALNQENTILFDVREAPEFSVSHLKGAIHVDPGMSEQDFIQQYADLSKGKTAIFYCSVGQRSSDLANRVQKALISSGAKAAYNLEGGIFKWHNESRPLFTKGTERTSYVHPYNPIWGRLVKDQENTRY